MAYQIIKIYKNKVHADKTDMISLRQKDSKCILLLQ